MSAFQRRAGVVLSYGALLAGSFVALLSVPLLLSFLSVAEFGVYELAGSLIAYLMLIDAGFSTALTRFLVTVRSESPTRIPRLLSTSLSIYLILTLIGVAAAMIFRGLASDLFGATFTASELAIAQELLLLVAINCVIIIPGNWFIALITAEQRFIFLRSVSIFKSVAQLGALFMVMHLDGGGWGVLPAQTLLNLVVFLLQVWYTFARLVERPKLGRPDWRLFLRLAAFSSNLLMMIVFDLVFWRTGQVVVGAVLGAAAVAVYAVATRLISSGFLQLSSAMSGVFLPHLTHLHASGGDDAEVDRLFVQLGRLQAIIAWGVIGVFVVLGERFVELWVGPEFHDVYPAVVWMMVGLAVSSVQSVGIQVMQARNRLGFRSVTYLVLAGLFLAFSPLVATTFGLVGVAALAGGLLFLGTGPVINFYYHMRLGLDVPKFWRAVLPLSVPVLIASVSCFFALPIFPPTWDGLLAGVGCFALVYAALVLLFLNPSERRALRLKW